MLRRPVVRAAAQVLFLLVFPGLEHLVKETQVALFSKVGKAHGPVVAVVQALWALTEPVVVVALVVPDRLLQLPDRQYFVLAVVVVLVQVRLGPVEPVAAALATLAVEQLPLELQILAAVAVAVPILPVVQAQAAPVL
jgi:hypothetical protein